MNLQINNFGHYRITNHGGRQYVLFNRQSDVIIDISQAAYKSIMQSEDPIYQCAYVYMVHMDSLDVPA